MMKLCSYEAWWLTFHQRGSIASCASAGIATVEMSVRPSVHHHTLVLYQNEHDFFTSGEPEYSSF